LAAGGVGFSKTFVPLSGVAAADTAIPNNTAETNDIFTLLARFCSQTRDQTGSYFAAEAGSSTTPGAHGTAAI